MAGSSAAITRRGGYIKAIVIDWVSDDTTGAASNSFHIDGQLIRLVTNPGATAPTDNYDITLPDSNAFDTLQGLGVNRDTATTEQQNIVISGTSVHPAVNDTVTFTIANAGNSKTGQAVIYYIGIAN